MGARKGAGPRGAAILLAAAALAGCTGGGKERSVTPAAAAQAAPIAPDDATSTSAAPAPTSSSTSVVAAEAALAPDLTVAGTATLGRGSKGPAVQAVEQRLSDLRFDVGKVDGTWDAATDQAVLSFQKQAGLPRSSKADEVTRTRLAGAPFGVPMVTQGAEPTRVEVDIERQVLQIWRDHKLYRVIGISSGNNRKYCDRSVKTGKKVCGVAVTPTGTFTFERRVPGLRKSDLGTLYDPVYFKDGYAVHGSPSVPAQPASHGCIRIPIRLSKWFFDNVPLGTKIHVLKDGAPPLPPSSPVDVPTTTTSTTLAPVTTAPTTTRPTASTTTPTTRPSTTTTRPAPTTTSPPTTTPPQTTTTTTGIVP